MPFCGRSTSNYNAFLAGTPIYTQRGHMASILLPREEPCFRAGRARRGDFDAGYFVWVTSSLHFHCASVIRGIVAFNGRGSPRFEKYAPPGGRNFPARLRVRILRRGRRSEKFPGVAQYPPRGDLAWNSDRRITRSRNSRTRAASVAFLRSAGRFRGERCSFGADNADTNSTLESRADSRRSLLK